MGHSFAYKSFFLMLLLVSQGLIVNKVMAQTRKNPNPIKPATAAALPDATVYTYVEQMPDLPEGGGMSGLVKCFMKHFQLSASEAKEATGGSVHVTFIVTETGGIVDARIARSGGSIIDAAALRAMRAMPRLHPGRQNGRPVKVRLTLPFSCIKLQ